MNDNQPKQPWEIMAQVMNQIEGYFGKGDISDLAVRRTPERIVQNPATLIEKEEL